MTLLLPNLGGEEGPAWRNTMAEPAVRTQRRLWRLLFPPEAELLGDDAPAAAAFDGAAFSWLEEGDAFAWFNSDEAAGDGRLGGAALAGAPVEIARAVHDKAFALGVAREERLVPSVLRGLLVPFEPEVLRAPDAADAVEAALADWPDWARERFTLKPRIGTSGRGRIAGAAGRLDRARLGRGLERLAERGGALLEPWLERTADLSVQMHLGGEAGVTVLGSLEQIVSPSGVFLGHRGELDSRGRVFSAHAEEEQLREAAARVGVAARARGYVGPCGVDSFEFVDPTDGEGGGRVLRPVVELNARFTAGTVTVGLVRRVLPRLKSELGLSPGDRMHFRFWLAPDAEQRAEAEARGSESGALLVPFEDAALLFEGAASWPAPRRGLDGQPEEP